jgi:hypothetical protein
MWHINYVCAYVRTNAHMHECMYIFMMDGWIDVCIDAHMYVMDQGMYECIPVCKHVCMHVCTHVPMRIDVNMYVCMHVYVYMYVCVCRECVLYVCSYTCVYLYAAMYMCVRLCACLCLIVCVMSLCLSTPAHVHNLYTIEARKMQVMQTRWSRSGHRTGKS